MADKEVLEIEVKLDTSNAPKTLAGIEPHAEKSGKIVGDHIHKGVSHGAELGAHEAVEHFNEISELAEGGFANIAKKFITSAINPITLGIAGVGAVFIGAFELALEGEKAKGVEKRFELLSEQFGIVPEKLKEGLERASGGTATLNDLLKKSSEAIVSLGANASRLPEIYELSRKAAKLTGDDTIAIYEKISLAIATGNTRSLKDIGLKTDVSRVYDTYARSIGVTADLLSEQGKQQALLNQILTVGNEKFKNVTGQTEPMSKGLKQIGVAATELKEAIAAIVNTKLGEFFADVIKSIGGGVRSIADKINELSGAPRSVAQEITTLQNKITRLNEMRLSNPNFAADYQRQIQAAGLALVQLQNKQRAIKEEESEEGDTPRDKSKDIAISLQQRFDAEFQASQKIRNLLADNLSARAALNANYYQSEESKLQANTDLQTAETLRGLNAVKAFEKENIVLRLVDAQAYEEQLALIKINSQQRLTQISLQIITDQQRLSALQFGSFSEGIRQASRATLDSVNKTGGVLNQLGTRVIDIFGNGFGNAFQKMGAAIKNGQNTFVAFRDAIFGTLSDIVSAFGDSFIKLGIGMIFLDPIAGAGLIAAGAACKILSGLIAPSGASSASSSTSVDSGSSSSFGNTSTALGSGNQLQSGPSVYVHIQGDVLDSQETGHRIYDIIASKFQTDGSQLPAGVVMS